MHHDSPDGHGVWMDDTRYLSDYKVLVNGVEPEATGLSADAGVLVFELTSGPLHIHLERYLTGGLHDRFTFTNPGTTSYGAFVDLMFAADFAAMLRVRGILPAAAPRPVAEVPGWQGMVLREAASDSHVTQVTVVPDGRHHRVELEPGQQFLLRVDVIPRGAAEVRDFDAGVQSVRESYATWSAECAHFETDNPQLNELIEQSRSDMRMLCDSYPTGVYPTGGLPWFAVPFGRDALFSSMFALPTNPDIARGALRFLAEHQGRKEDAGTEEQLGKILHEVRRGEVVESGVWPNILFGTVDATPLFLCGLAEMHDWTGDDALLVELRPAAQMALAWCFQYGDSDQDGWIDYMSARGWKDSDDSLTHTDGSKPLPPAALCEVQAYFYRGLTGMARVWPDLKSKADEIERKFNHDFWMGRSKFVAQALDGEGGACARFPTRPRTTTRAATTTAPYGRTTARSRPLVCAAPGAIAKRSCWREASWKRGWLSPTGARPSCGAATRGSRASSPTTIATAAARRTGPRRRRSRCCRPCSDSRQTRRTAGCASRRSGRSCSSACRSPACISKVSESISQWKAIASRKAASRAASKSRPSGGASTPSPPPARPQHRGRAQVSAHRARRPRAASRSAAPAGRNSGRQV
ncbi:MAG: hypothetical protein E6I77_04940 [Chloroflexi bacterium]|nr:MAG: hypothetical protein E6I77_04940 [Chloroflexota bacterium]